MSQEVLGDAIDFLRGYSDLNESDDYESVARLYADPDDGPNLECVFGDDCLMPGYHTSDECYTAEMAEEWAEDAANAPL